jgi:hypothetical protein
MFRSLKFKLIAYFSIIVIVISVGLGLMASFSSVNALRNNVDEELEELAKAYGKYIEAELREAKVTM